MAYNNLTGNVIVNIEYRLTQEDESSHLEDHGVIDYNLSLGSGTGISQINDLWYADRGFTTTDSVDLAALSLRRFGQVYTTSFIGVSDQGNVKGVKLDNKSNETMYLSLPFKNFTGNIEIAPSGSIILSNSNGWTITPLTSTVSISGDTSDTKQYSLGFLGVALPLIINSDAVLNYDYLASGIGSGTGIPSGTMMIDWLMSGEFSGTTQLDYLLDYSGFSGELNIDYLGEAAVTGTGTIPIDFLAEQNFDVESLNVEWTGFAATTGGSGTGFGELLGNPRLFPGYVPLEQIGDTGVGLGIGYPSWHTSGDYISYGWQNGESRTVDFILGFSRWFAHWSNPFNAKCVKCRQTSYLKQTVTVVPGATYRFEWYPFSLFMATDQTERPYVQLLAGDGTVLSKQLFTHEWWGDNQRTWVTMDAVAIDDQLTVEFYKPADKHPRTPPYQDQGLYCTYFIFGSNISSLSQYDKVSLYRVL
jgi:hypothetical protein